MITVPVRTMSGGEAGSYELDPADLAPRISKQLLHDVVVMYEANKRQGSAKTKTRGEVAGNKKKMFRQKGTGNARMGTKRSPVRRGGGHAFAKSPRDFSYRLPKKAVRLATRMALLSKFQDGEAVVLDELSLSGIKTKPVAQMLSALGLGGKRVLLVIPGHDPEVWMSSRNISGLKVSPASDLNAYDLLSQKHLVVTREAIDQLRKSGSAVAAAE